MTRLAAVSLLICAALVLAAPPATSKSKQKLRVVDAGDPNEPPRLRDGGIAGNFRWDVPGLIEDVPVQGPLKSAGIPIKAHAVRTSWKGQELVDFMVRRFGEAGLWIVPPNRMVQLRHLPQITAFDPLQRISYTVMFQANVDGTTTLILSEANLALRDAVDGAPLLVHPPGAAQLVTHQSEGVATVSYATHLPPEKVLAHYAPQLSNHGLKPTDELHFEGAKGSVDLLFEQNRDGGTAVVVVAKLKPPSPPPQAQPDDE